MCVYETLKQRGLLGYVPASEAKKASLVCLSAVNFLSP